MKTFFKALLGVLAVWVLLLLTAGSVFLYWLQGQI